MATDTAVGGVTGAAQGAAAGAAFGPIGIVAGAIIGGALGALGGDRRRKAKRYAAKAAEVRRKQQTMKLAIERRDVVRQFRLARAQAVAAGASEGDVGSSAIQGASSSLTSQTKGSLSYFDTQVALDNQYQAYAKKAGKAAGQAEDLSALVGVLGEATTAGVNAYGLYSLRNAGSAGYSTLAGNPKSTQTGSNFKTYPYVNYGDSVTLGP